MLLILPLSLMQVGCNEKDPSSIRVLDKATGEMISLITTGCQETQYELVVVGDNWTAENSSDWCMLSRKSGHYGQEEVTLIVKSSANSTPREATITFRSGSAQHRIVVSQGEKTEYLNLMPNSATVDYKAGTISFTVDSNIDWTATSTSEWVRVTAPADGAGTDTRNVVLAYDQYSSHTTSRSAEIIITSVTGEANTVFKLKQLQRGEAVIDAATGAYSFEQAGGQTTIAIFHNLMNTTLTTASTASWCTPTIVGSSVKIVATANPTNDERTAIVTVLNHLNGVAVMKQITISQAGIAAPKLTLGRETVVMGNLNETFMIPFIGDNITVTSSAEWLEVTTNYYNAILGQTDENESGNLRSATVTVVAQQGLKTITKYITVHQNGAGALDVEISPNEVFIDGYGGAITLTARINSSASQVGAFWTPVAADWCEVETTTNLEGSVATYNVDENETYYDRECSIVVLFMVGDRATVRSVVVKQGHIGENI